MINTNIVLMLILGFGALGAGLGALKLNLLSMVGLSPLGRALKLICGAAGLMVLYYIFTQYDAIKAMNTPLDCAIMHVLVITNICIGISGLGTNVLRVMNLEGVQKALQLAAGAAGVYALSIGLRLLAQ